MIRRFQILVVSLALTGYAFAQAPQLQRAPAGASGGFGRGPALPPVVIGPPAPVPPEVAIPRPTPAELAQVNDALKRSGSPPTSRRQTAASKVSVAADASAPAREQCRDLHADRAAEGAAPSGLRRDRQQGRHRSAAPRRLHHRLVGAGRRQQGDVRQVFRQHQDGQLRRRRRHHARAFCGA